IADGKPGVIGVDIDTSDSQWQNVASGSLLLSREETSFVWEQEALGQEEPLRPVKVLGGAEVTPKPVSGISGLFQDWDGVIRRSRRSFSTAGESEGQIQLVDSFPWAIVKAFCEKSPKASRLCSDVHQPIRWEIPDRAKIEREKFLNFSGNQYDFPTYAASFVLTAHEADWWRDKSPFRGKIVLLGGSFR